MSYDELCALFYDLDKPSAPELALAWYERALRDCGGRVLEPMCGSGRFLLPLTQRGLVVDGTDPSEPMLKRCRERLMGAHIAVDSPWGTTDPSNAEDHRDGSYTRPPMVRLRQQTLEELDLKPAPAGSIPVAFEPYTAAFIPASSFCLIVDRDAAARGLVRLREHLAPGGLVLIEFELPHPAENWPAETTRTITDGGRQIRLTSRAEYDAAEQIETHTNHYELKQSGKVVATEDEVLRLRCYAPDEMRAALETAGFRGITIVHPEFGWVACASSG